MSSWPETRVSLIRRLADRNDADAWVFFEDNYQQPVYRFARSRGLQSDDAMDVVAAARKRFAMEARAMAAISHEHDVPVYTVDEHRGLPYFAMEYVPGGTLVTKQEATGARVLRIGPCDLHSLESNDGCDLGCRRSWLFGVLVDTTSGGNTRDGNSFTNRRSF